MTTKVSINQMPLGKLNEVLEKGGSPALLAKIYAARAKIFIGMAEGEKALSDLNNAEFHYRAMDEMKASILMDRGITFFNMNLFHTAIADFINALRCQPISDELRGRAEFYLKCAVQRDRSRDIEAAKQLLLFGRNQ